MTDSVSPSDAVVFHPDGAREPASRDLLVESALTIRLAGGPDITLMRTPGADRELVIGFLRSEGLIAGLADLGALEQCEDREDAVRVALAAAAPREGDRRSLLVGSACSLCGREHIDAILDGIPAVASEARFPARVLGEVARSMQAAQPLFRRTGASHAAALFDVVCPGQACPAGFFPGSPTARPDETGRGTLRTMLSPDFRLLVVHEDIGRHNALDKVIGHGLLTGLTLGACGAMLSGRASFEMLTKAARAGLPLVAAVSAPSALAVEAARRLGVTLCGFVRGAEFTCYAHPERLVVR